ncbi:MAG: hypothetical protein LC650_01965 [Actinobacteria bacterium]|nr:hypothetical protein [Actinomycetota bacterium]
MISSRRAQAPFATLIFLGMIFLVFLLATPVIFEILSINDPGGVTGFVLKMSPAVILLLILVRGFKVAGRGDILG